MAPSLLSVVLTLAAATGVRAFVVQPAIASARCGGTSCASRHATWTAATTSRVSALQEAHAACSDTMAMADSSDGWSRGAWAGRVLGAAFTGAVAVAQGPRFALAELGVGEGGLPNGAKQFSNLVKVQKDWAALGSSLTSQGADVTPEEWKNVSLFLRKVYQLGGDLEYLAGTFPSDKKKSAVALVRSIQKEVQAADGPAREKDAKGFLAAQASVQKKFEEFVELFNDVPAEL